MKLNKKLQTRERERERGKTDRPGWTWSEEQSWPHRRHGGGWRTPCEPRRRQGAWPCRPSRCSWTPWEPHPRLSCSVRSFWFSSNSPIDDNPPLNRNPVIRWEYAENGSSVSCLPLVAGLDGRDDDDLQMLFSLWLAAVFALSFGLPCHVGHFL